MNVVDDKILQCILDVAQIDINKEEFDYTIALSELGINSLTYIKIVVKLEELFDIEFEDEWLSFIYANNIGRLIEYINEKNV